MIINGGRFQSQMEGAESTGVKPGRAQSAGGRSRLPTTGGVVRPQVLVRCTARQTERVALDSIEQPGGQCGRNRQCKLPQVARPPCWLSSPSSGRTSAKGTEAVSGKQWMVIDYGHHMGASGYGLLPALGWVSTRMAGRVRPIVGHWRQRMVQISYQGAILRPSDNSFIDNGNVSMPHASRRQKLYRQCTGDCIGIRIVVRHNLKFFRADHDRLQSSEINLHCLRYILENDGENLFLAAASVVLRVACAISNRKRPAETMRTRLEFEQKIEHAEINSLVVQSGKADKSGLACRLRHQMTEDGQFAGCTDVGPTREYIVLVSLNVVQNTADRVRPQRQWQTVLRME